MSKATDFSKERHKAALKRDKVRLKERAAREAAVAQDEAAAAKAAPKKTEGE